MYRLTVVIVDANASAPPVDALEAERIAGVHSIQRGRAAPQYSESEGGSRRGGLPLLASTTTLRPASTAGAMIPSITAGGTPRFQSMQLPPPRRTRRPVERR
jgi:hypothetical protein